VVAVAAAERDARTRLPGLLVERKGRFAVTVHWRTAPDREAEALRETAALAEHHGLVAHRGRLAMELRPPVPVDKGTVVEDLVRAAGARVGVFAGDDAGDLSAFAALGRLRAAGTLAHAVRIAVRSVEAPPELLEADVVVDGPGELAAVLDALGRAISERA
jgi:trehalose 6-phosphate phosphatase